MNPYAIVLPITRSVGRFDVPCLGFRVPRVFPEQLPVHRNVALAVPQAILRGNARGEQRRKVVTDFSPFILPRWFRAHDLVSRKVSRQKLLQGHRVDGLCQVFREALCQISLPRADHCVRGQADNRCVLARAARARADAMQRLRSVHFRHALVHQDHVVCCLLRHRHSVRTAGRRIDLHLCVLQQVDHHGQVHPRIVHDQYAGCRSTEGFLISCGLHDVRSEPRLEIAYRRVGDDLLRNPGGEHGTFPVFTLHGDVAAHHLQQALRNHETEAGTLHGVVTVHLQALEPGEQLVVVFGTDADPRILHGG